MKKQTILFIEDDRAGRELGVFNLGKAGYEVVGVSTGEEGLTRFDPAVHDLVITDVRMPGISGMEVLAGIKKRSPSTQVLVITAFADVDLAVEAMKEGAFDFIGKPFNRDHLLLVVSKAMETSNLTRELKELRVKAAGIERSIVYQSHVMRQTLEMADRFAASDATVLVTGESGTGKELIARRIHARSTRSQGPFVVVNAAAMPEQLLESELFGHEKGAFTGASKKRGGRFRQADGGSIFLDEIGELPLSLQGKLLRVLQERVVDVLGSDEPASINVRVITATNRDLEAEVAQGRFREDLYYRINVVEVRVPSLRERIDDIELLASYFVAQHSPGRDLIIPAEVSKELKSMDWPGNVRQLENYCQRMAILSTGGSVSAADLPGSSVQPTGTHVDEEWPHLPDDGLSLLDLEKRVIERVLVLKGGNVSQAAVYLRIPRHVLAYRMEKYGISRGK